LIGNYFQQPNTFKQNSKAIHLLYANPEDANTIFNPKLYLHDNLSPIRQNITDDEWKLVASDITTEEENNIYAAAPLFTSSVNPIPATQVPNVVLANAGATLPVRDRVDARIVKQIRKGKGTIINSQEDVGGY